MTADVQILCARARGCKGRQDWLTLEASPDFNVCPTCFDTVFSKTGYRKHFYSASTTNLEQLVKCDLGSPWMWNAWLLTQERRLPDLELLQAISTLESSRMSCTGAYEVRTWYTFMDKRGKALESFHICACDKKKIEVLAPSLRGYLAKTKTRSRERRCDLRADSTRFHEYLELLLDIDAHATRTRKAPSLSSFFDLVRAKAHIEECPRGVLLQNAAWHFNPALPEFTVCKDCYDSTVRPAAADGSSIALAINKSPVRHIDGDNQGVSGHSCQLYSQRMRAVFDKAVARNDFGYLARRATDRKDVEIELTQQEAVIKLTEEEMVQAGLHRETWKSQSRYAVRLTELKEIKEEWLAYE